MLTLCAGYIQVKILSGESAYSVLPTEGLCTRSCDEGLANHPLSRDHITRCQLCRHVSGQKEPKDAFSLLHFEPFCSLWILPRTTKKQLQATSEVKQSATYVIQQIRVLQLSEHQLLKL